MFIVFEGLDGSGKSTILEKIKSLFQNKNLNFISTKEPFGTKYKDLFKETIHKKDFLNFSSLQFLLFQAERMTHLKEIIIPALNDKKIVISDRFLPSSLVYQGLNGKLNVDFMTKIHDEFCENEFNKKIHPDLIFYFHASDKILKERIKSKKNLDHFDEGTFQEIKKFKEYYSIILNKKNLYKKLIKIDTSFDNPDETTKFIFEIIKNEIMVKDE